MPIPNPNPIVIPESAPQTFDSYWVSNISFFIESPAKAAGRIEVKPFDSENLDILQDKSEVIFINDLWESYQAIPEVKTAVDAIIAAVAALKAKQ